MIDLSSAWNGKVFLGELLGPAGDPLEELAVLAPGGPNRRVFLSRNEENAMRVAMSRLEGPWARYGGFIPSGVRTIIVDPLAWGKHLVGLAEACREKGINLVSDERRTSPGVSGHPFLCEAFSVKPDAIIIGRGWANGEDLWGFIARPSRLTEILPKAEETGLSCISKVIGRLRREGLEMAREKGRLIKEFLEKAGIRGRGAGALWLLEVPEPDGAAARLEETGYRISRHERGLVLAPPLDLGNDVLTEGLRALFGL
jgi:hypothetical protein